jgi:adenylate kinase
MDISEVSTEALMREMQRRLECLNKPEKRIILVGAWRRGRAASTQQQCLLLARRDGMLTCSPLTGPPGCGKGTQSPKIKARCAAL